MILYGFTRHGVQCMSHMNCFYGAFYSFSELDGSRPHSWYGGADMINDQMTFFWNFPLKVTLKITLKVQVFCCNHIGQCGSFMLDVPLKVCWRMLILFQVNVCQKTFTK